MNRNHKGEENGEQNRSNIMLAWNGGNWEHKISQFEEVDLPMEKYTHVIDRFIKMGKLKTWRRTASVLCGCAAASLSKEPQRVRKWWIWSGSVRHSLWRLNQPKTSKPEHAQKCSPSALPSNAKVALSFATGCRLAMVTAFDACVRDRLHRLKGVRIPANWINWSTVNVVDQF